MKTAKQIAASIVVTAGESLDAARYTLAKKMPTEVGTEALESLLRTLEKQAESVRMELVERKTR